MDSTAIPLAISACLIGSSAASYIFGILSNAKKSKALENQIKELLEHPDVYYNARNNHLLNNVKPWHEKTNGKYVVRR